MATRASLRRKINLLNQLEKISKYSESASKLYNSVKVRIFVKYICDVIDAFQDDNVILYIGYFRRNSIKKREPNQEKDSD